MSTRKVLDPSALIRPLTRRPVALLATALVLGSTSPAQSPEDVRWQGVMSAPGNIYALCAFGSELVVGGQFTGDDQAGVRRFDGVSTWSSLGDGLVGPFFDAFPVVHTLTPYGSRLAVGGRFSLPSGYPLQNVAVWDGASWSPLPGLPRDLERIDALGVYDSSLIAAGLFGFGFGGPDPRFIARASGSGWSPLGSDPQDSGLSPEVAALAVYADDLIAGGTFFAAGGNPIPYLARWNGAAWTSLGSGVDGPVRDLAVYEGELIAAGFFSSAGGVPAQGIARWNGTAWADLGVSAPEGVSALAVLHGKLFAGGSLHQGGQVIPGVLGQWNGSDWAPLGSGLSNTIAGFGLIVTDLAPFGDKLAVSGYFSTAGLQGANGLALWDDSALDTTPPTVAILSPANGATFGTTSVSVTASVSDGSATTVTSTPPGISASLPAGTATVGGTLPLAAEGANLLVVSATDSALNVGQTSVTVYRDTTRPTIAILSPGEGSVFGTTSVGFTLDVRDLSATSVEIGASTLALPAGGGTLAVMLALGEGSHSILVTATDALGNRETAARTVIVDLSAPAVTILDPQPSPVPCFGPGSSPIPVTAQIVDQTASSALFQPGGATGSVAAGGGVLTRSVPLVEGANLISVSAQDDAGNEGIASFTVILDTTPPVVALSSPPPAALLRGTGVDVAISAEDPLPGSGIDHVELFVDADLRATFAAPPFETSLDTTLLADGSHVLGARAVDGKGNAGTAELVLVAVDNTQPMLTILEPFGGSTVGGAIAFTVLASDGTSGITTAVLTAGGSAPSPVDPSFTGQPPVTSTLLEASVDTSLQSDGPLTLAVTAIDAAGNESQTSVVVNVDNSAPPVCTLLPSDQSVVAGVVPIVAEVSGNFTTLEVRVDGATVAGPTVSALVSVPYDTTQRLDGAMTVTALVTHGAGLTLTCTSHVTIDNVSFELTPAVLNLKTSGNAPVHARLEGPSVGLLLPTEAHGIQLRVCGGSPVPSLAGWAGDDATSDGDHDGVPELSVRFSRGALVAVIQAGIACGTIERGSLVEVELWAEVSATSQGSRIGSTLVRSVGNP